MIKQMINKHFHIRGSGIHNVADLDYFISPLCYKKAVFRIRISFHADPDPDPGSQKCPYGSGSKEVNTKKE